VIAWGANDGVDQKWRYRDGFLENNLNRLVMDVEEASEEQGTKIVMFKEKEVDNQNQKWHLVPQEMIEFHEFVIESSNNPLIVTAFRLFP
jgi:DNA-binding FadR family transcriptional regulator